jgi:hypothetical protein
MRIATNHVDLVKHDGDGNDLQTIAHDITREQATGTLRGLKAIGANLDHYDLVSVETGRFVSWVIA